MIQAVEYGYKVAEDIAKYGKPFIDRVFAKQAFPSCAEVLFDDLPDKCTIISRIKDMAVSPRTVDRRINNMATDVTEQQTCCFKSCQCFQRSS